MSVYKASRVFFVPEQTLRDRVKEKVPLTAKLGYDNTFTFKEEEALAQHLIYMAGIGYGYTKMDIQRMARQYAHSLNKKLHTKNENTDHLSNNWFYGFLRRWPDLKLVKPQKLSMARAKNASPEKMKAYFKELSTILTKHELADKPNQIFNIDETGISTDHSPPKIVCGKDVNPRSITSPRSSTITIIAGGNAAGHFLPPFYVFPGKRWNADFLNVAISGSSGAMSDSGWSNGKIFEQYLTTHFLENARRQNQDPVLILLDGHRSHISLTLTDWAQRNNIILFVLPPHSSHLTQPLDVGVFGPLKKIYNRECAVFLQKHPGRNITKYDIAELTATPYLKAMCPDNLISAFRKTGVFPVDPKAITDQQMAPSIIYVDADQPQLNVESGEPCSQGHLDHDHPSSQSRDSSLQQEHATTQPLSQTRICNDPPDFFSSRKITAVKTESKKKRKFIPPFLAGSLLKKTNQDILKSAEGKKKKKVLEDTQPSTSGASTTEVKKSKKTKDPIIEDGSDCEAQTEDEVCCVCQRWEPAGLRSIPGILFVQWGKCDFCSHWTHLKFCTNVRVLRTSSTFRCPHCE
ncbi:uncharacterized protein LOC134247943 [Saccostrea cucullata]|uniref:uncharacterized protein LOC134247943 n=1 Tax=Saccostrea cuccullata TaxID=36930 RepID=UPI002ED13DF1